MSGAQVTVAVDLSTPTASVDSTILVRRTGVLDTVRITASDLRAAQRKRSWIQAEHEKGGASGGLDVLLDVVVHIATDARTARSEARWQSPTTDTDVDNTIVYVGTPSGLASLILDIRAADIADGVTVIPAVMEGDSRDACVQQLLGEVLPILEARGLVPDVTVRQPAG
ncbi:hypothetical protein [Rhodococcus opacus]|uniref:hypothetical protein n=1 Tax=Rhodococcus opacus TaxID=37919 RepID=UPI0029533809|nr:hypothetical protein [Rhodococcus opacus]MDV7087379.1 hypothetical protein [Rhodococcus opacus]